MVTSACCYGVTMLRAETFGIKSQDWRFSQRGDIMCLPNMSADPINPLTQNYRQSQRIYCTILTWSVNNESYFWRRCDRTGFRLNIQQEGRSWQSCNLIDPCQREYVDDKWPPPSNLVRYTVTFLALLHNSVQPWLPTLASIKISFHNDLRNRFFLSDHCENQFCSREPNFWT